MGRFLSFQVRVLAIGFFAIGATSSATLWDCQRSVLWAVSGYDIGGWRESGSASPASQYFVSDFGPIASLGAPFNTTYEKIEIYEGEIRSWRTHPDRLRDNLEEAVRTACIYGDADPDPKNSLGDQAAMFGEATGLEDRMVASILGNLERVQSGRDGAAYSRFVSGKPIQLLRLGYVGNKNVELNIKLTRLPDGFYVIDFRRPERWVSDYLWFRLQNDVFFGQGPLPKRVEAIAEPPIGSRYKLTRLVSNLQTVVVERMNLRQAFLREPMLYDVRHRLKKDLMKYFFSFGVLPETAPLPFKETVKKALETANSVPTSLRDLLAFIDNTPGWSGWNGKSELKEATLRGWKEYENNYFPINPAFELVAESSDRIKLTLSGKVEPGSLNFKADGTLDVEKAQVKTRFPITIKAEPLTPTASFQPSLRQVQEFVHAIRYSIEEGIPE